ncbi:thiolase domain-containing protein [Litorivivens sp.]|uniref:thiolase domain-containing protein n=1 Tax=Litorivivens sp. TaxID=2020868 RepID=UPI003561D4AB
MRDVAIVSYAQAPMQRDAGGRTDVELLVPVMDQALAGAQLGRKDIDFVCSGSCDYLAGAAFSFVMAVDALGATPCAQESHVEMDAAWALYEAWLKFQCGEIDTALIYGFGKSAPGDLPDVLSLQLDPYYTQPLWPDSISLAAIQAQMSIAKGCFSEREMAQVVAESRRNAQRNPHAQLKGEYAVDGLLSEPTFVSPLRRHDCSPISDGCSVLILASKEKAAALCERPAWIKGLDHRMESHFLGTRDLTTSASSKQSAEALQLDRDKLDCAELYAPFSHQQLILQQALGLKENTDINRSGGALAGHVLMAAGLDRFGAAAQEIFAGRADRALAHATSGPCLQQNLFGVLEGAA